MVCQAQCEGLPGSATTENEDVVLFEQGIDLAGVEGENIACDGE